MPMPSSSTSTSIRGPRTRARTTTVPPDGEYLKAFSSSWPTMMSVAIPSPYPGGRSAGTPPTTTRLSDARRPGDGPEGGPAVGVRELLPPARQGRGETLHHGDRRAQLVAGRRQEKILRLFEFLGRGDVAEVDHLLAPV